MNFDFRKHRTLLIIIGLTIVVGLSLPPLMSASCATLEGTPAELKAIETLKMMTRGGVLPADSVVAQIESEFPDTKAAGLARIIRAEIKLKANDAAGAAVMLGSKTIYSRTAIGDHALQMRAQALEQAARRDEARDVYLQLAKEYPTSIRARDASLRAATMLSEDGKSVEVIALLKDLSAKDDARALLLTAKAFEQTGDPGRAVAAYRRIYFHAPESDASAEAQTALTKLNSSIAPASAEDAAARAEKLFEAKRFGEANTATADAFKAFAATATPSAQLHQCIAAAGSRNSADALAALNAMPTSQIELRAECDSSIAQSQVNAKNWVGARATIEDMRRAFPKSLWTARALVSAGIVARDAKNANDAAYFFRAAVAGFPETGEVAQAQFEIAWLAHDAKNYQESSRLLTEHLAYYADKNNDNRGRAGYWAARDLERAGKLDEARAIFTAMQGRYSANWYGYLSKQRLDAIKADGIAKSFAPDSVVGRAIRNLQTVTIAEETAGASEEERIARAEELVVVGMTDQALEELAFASKTASASPRVNLSTAKIYQWREDNLAAFNTLRKSFPDYSQMQPEEMTRDEWAIFYPLAYWDTIVHESKAKGLDPYQVAGLIRQETVFNPKARSPARAYGLMQLLVPTATLVSKRYNTSGPITAEALYEPKLNIQLGTAYFRDQMDKYGRIEFVTAAYNAGPHRVEEWKVSLPSDMDEWAESVPFKETRSYIQGVVRNTLQYRRLYDETGQFRPIVGTRANRGPGAQPADATVRQRRISGNEREE